MLAVSGGCDKQYWTEVRTGCVCTIARRARAPAALMPQLYRLDCQMGKRSKMEFH